MGDLIFFYGTLMTGFTNEGRTRVGGHLKSVGKGSINALLFDLGLYPGAIPASDSRVRGELHQIVDIELALAILDEFEGYSASDPFTSLYVREETTVQLDDGQLASAWVYFYNGPLGTAPRIQSGDYVEFVKSRGKARREGDVKI
jgi:gamma-glutamylcyclotransferase (GGCT)/AIG2-like uncharacterized protein YtfP